MKTLIRAKEDTDFVWLKYREGNKVDFKQIPFRNYILMKPEDWTNNKTELMKFNKYFEPEIFENEVRLYLKDNLRRNELKYRMDTQNIPHYEADIMANKRWLLDKREPIHAENLTWLMYDIETKDDGLFEKDLSGTIIAREPILSIAYKDNTGKELWIKNENKDDPVAGEVELLNKHYNIMQQYDIILGWNSYRFDDSYIKQRSILHGLTTLYWDFINQMDYMETVKKNYGGLESYSLNKVAGVVLGEQKVVLDGEKGKGAIYNSWLKSFDGDDLLERYNKFDVEIMYLIEQKLNFIELQKKEANLANCFIQETLHNSDICDYMLLPRFRDAGILSPSKPNPKEVERRKESSILGAYTFCLKPGVHENVFVFDFKSFYPTTMTANNICITTKLEEPNENCVVIPEDELERNGKMVKAHTKYFDNTKRGIISDVAGWLVEERDKIKYAKFQYIKSNPDKFREMKLDENAIKTVANSLYGAMSFIYFRYYDYDVASSITQFCRGIIRLCIKHAESLGFEVIQGDTDSIMFTQGTAQMSYKDLEYEFYLLFDKVAKERNINSRNFSLKNPKTGKIERKSHFIVFEHEKTFKKMISIKKKNYADLMEVMDGDGNPTGQIEISITGLECKKKDTNPLARKIQYNLIEAILKDGFDEFVFLEYLKKLKQNFLHNKIDTKYLVMKKSLNKDVSEYGKAMIDSKTGKPKLKKDGTPRFSSVPAHVKLAKELIEQGHDIYVGDQISYIVKETGPIVPISVFEYKDGADYDREYYWDRIIKPVLKILFVTHPKLVLKNGQLWTMKELDEKKLERFVSKLKKEVDKLE